MDSQLGARSCFTVTLPRWERTAAPGPPPREVAKYTGVRTQLRILLAEDEPIVARACKAGLGRMGHEVTHVIDGMEAWNVLQGAVTSFDLLLVDINMPRLSGVDFVRRVRTTSYQGRVVVMSGRVASCDLQELQSLQVDRVLAKPFTLAELDRAIQPPSEKGS